MTDRKTPEEVLAEVRKANPNVRIFKGSSPEAQLQIQLFGIPDLDLLCRGTLCGGYTILYGPNQTGKSTLMAKKMAQMQADGRRVLLVDLEGRMDPDWMALQGVNLDDLYIQRGGLDLEEDLNVLNEQIQAGAFEGIAMDSISAKAARGEIQDKKGKSKGIEDDTVALLARQLSKWFRRITPFVGSQRIPVCLLSQVRATNIHSGAFLDMTGGNAPKHWGSTILQLGRGEKIVATIDGEKRELGYWLRVRLKKTSLCGNEGQECFLPFYFGIGIDDVAALARSAIKQGIAQLTASKTVVFGDKTHRSEVQFVRELRENEALADALMKQIALAHAPAPDPAEQAEAANPMVEVEGNVDDGAQYREEDGQFVCTVEGCGQVTNSLRGLKIHQGRVHKS